MKKINLLSCAILVTFSTHCLAGKEKKPDFGDEINKLIEQGRPNGQSPHQLGHYGELTGQEKTRKDGGPLSSTRGTTFYLSETSDRY